MDFFVVFSDTWCATVPESWINADEKTVAWPNKKNNATLACKRGVTPKPDWKFTKYTRLLGPYKDYDTARAVEIAAVDISTSDEKSLQQILDEPKKIAKRQRKKPARLAESDSDSDESTNDDEDESNTGRSVEISKEKVLPTFVYQQVKDPKEKLPPTFTFQVLEDNNNNIEIDDLLESQPLDYGTFFDDHPNPLFNTTKTNMIQKPVVRKVEKIHTSLHAVKNNQNITTPNQSANSLSDAVNTDKFQSTGDPKSKSITFDADLLNQNTKQLRKFDDDGKTTAGSSGNLNLNNIDAKNHTKADSVSSQAIAPSQISQTDNTAKDPSAPSHNCCPACRLKLDAMARKLDILLMNLNTDNSRQSSVNSPSVLPDFPIASLQNLVAFNELLTQNDQAKKQYTDLISLRRNPNGKKNIREVLGHILSDDLACKLSWSGQKKTIKVENMPFVTILRDTIIGSNPQCALNDCKQVIMSWLQHANDRVKLDASKHDNDAQ